MRKVLRVGRERQVAEVAALPAEILLPVLRGVGPLLPMTSSPQRPGPASQPELTARPAQSPSTPTI
jgi:hypothetical protein